MPQNMEAVENRNPGISSSVTARSPDYVPTFQYQYVDARVGKVRRGSQSIVPAPDDYDVVLGLLSHCSLPAADRLVSAVQAFAVDIRAFDGYIGDEIGVGLRRVMPQERTRSARFPTSIDPTSVSLLKATAELMVYILSASIGVTASSGETGLPGPSRHPVNRGPNPDEWVKGRTRVVGARRHRQSPHRSCCETPLSRRCVPTLVLALPAGPTTCK